VGFSKSEEKDGLVLDKIVVLLDGSPLAQSVLPHTSALAQNFGAEVILLQVLEPKDKIDTGRLDMVDWHLRKMEAQSFLDAVSRKLEGEKLHPKTVLLEGSAAKRIIEYIDETDPDLIMLSSHGQSGLSPWNVSSVAQKIIHRACKSFMLVRAYQQQSEQAGKASYRRIVVPLDGSKRAECVLPYATRLAAVENAEVVLVHALAPPDIMQRHTLTAEEREAVEQLSRRNEAEAERYLSQVAAQIEPKTITHPLPGSNAAHALLEFVNNNEVDLVVMSAHGYSSQTMRPYGSVVSSFIDYSSTALLLIQDLPSEQIRPVPRKLNTAAGDDNTPLTNRTLSYAQPAVWFTS
jgi:nucleotide-binding universal stress UspA family protein